MPVTATLPSTVIADAEVHVELLDTYDGVAAPTVIGNPITTITATVNGVSATVNVTSLTAGAKGFAIPFFFAFGHLYTLVITVTTADSNPNVFNRTFTVRMEDVGAECDEVRAVGPIVGFERVDVRVLGPLAGFSDRVELYATFLNNSFVDEVRVAVIAGLTAGYFSVDRVELISASIEIVDIAYPLTFNVGTADDAYYALSEEVQAIQYAAMSISEDAIATETNEYPLSLEQGDIADGILPLTQDIGNPDDAGLPLTVEGAEELIVGIMGRGELRNEELAAAEDEF